MPNRVLCETAFRVIVRHPYGYIARLLKSYGYRAVIIRTYHGVRTFIVRPPCDCCAFLMGYGCISPLSFNRTACIFLSGVGGGEGGGHDALFGRKRKSDGHVTSHDYRRETERAQSEIVGTPH